MIPVLGSPSGTNYQQVAAVTVATARIAAAAAQIDPLHNRICQAAPMRGFDVSK